ncbi:MAG: citrate synthase [Bacteroidota bacterium]
MTPAPSSQQNAKNSLSVVDNRTGKQFEIPITDNTIKAMDFRQMKTGPEDFGLMTYDPAFMNTASCRSAITYIDGDKGILRYRGYPIEQIGEKCSYVEVAYLLMFGEVPTPAQLAEWTKNITAHTPVHENLKKIMDGFQQNGHPMSKLIAGLAALSTLYPSSKNVGNRDEELLSAYRLLGKTPVVAAYGYRHGKGLPYVDPDSSLSYAGNFLNMMFSKPGTQYKPDPVLVRALDILFILHADHEQNCSTNTMRGVGSSKADPFSSAAAATCALYGPLHGGANEAVLFMLDEIDSLAKVPAFIKDVKEGKGKLMGFGHRVYKNFDPRASIIKKLADQVFGVTGRNPKLDIALELERIALQDDYFVSRKLYPNVDFYSGLIYQALGFPTEFFTVLFAIGRMSGWVAQWVELVNDGEQKISRPRQVYTGHDARNLVK